MRPIIPLWMKPGYTSIRHRLEKVVRCLYCGGEVLPEMKFCPKCGKNLINPEIKTRQQKERGH